MPSVVDNSTPPSDAIGGPPSDADFARAGLLKGLEGAAAQVRCRALRALADEGVPMSELVAIVREHRLAAVLLERTIGHVGLFTLPQVAEQAQLETAEVKAWFRALGRAMPVAADTPVYGEDDVLMASRLREYLEMGLDRESLFATARLWGRNTARMADAMSAIMEDGLLAAHDDPDVVLHFAVELRRMAEIEGRITSHVLGLILAQRLGSSAVSVADSRGGPLRGERDVSVCFADLVGFTRLGERLSTEMLSEVADHLSALATDMAEPPVRLFKTIGDAVMLVCGESEPLVDTALALVEEAQGQGMPPLRASVASGLAISRAGDLFGRPINLASRILGVAKPRTVVVPDTVRVALPAGRFGFTSLGEHMFKGVDGPTPLYGVHRSVPA
jgi:adenylate cyclase